MTEYCDEGDSDGCTHCEDGYAIDKDTGKCLEAINCEEVYTNGTCKYCSNGYEVLSSSNRCYNQGCESTECSDGYYSSD